MAIGVIWSSMEYRVRRAFSVATLLLVHGHAPWCMAQSIGLSFSGSKASFNEPQNTSIQASLGFDQGFRAVVPIGKHGLTVIDFGRGRIDVQELVSFPEVVSPMGYTITRSSSMERNHVDVLFGREVLKRRRMALHVLSGIRVVGWAGYALVELKQPSGTVTHLTRRSSEWRSDIGLILSGRITWSMAQRISLAFEPHAFGVIRDGSASYARPGYSPRPSLNWLIGTRASIEFRIFKKSAL